jgi:hypothetical protein
MEADESHSADEAQPPSCIAPNANGGQDASPVYWFKCLAVSFCSRISCILCSLQCMLLIFISLGYSGVREVFVEQGIPVPFSEQSYCIEGGE